jgi:hypothetical protein
MVSKPTYNWGGQLVPLSEPVFLGLFSKGARSVGSLEADLIWQFKQQQSPKRQESQLLLFLYFVGGYTLVNIQKTIENGHRNS